MRAGVKRLELTRLRVCGRCGRAAAELRSDDGPTIVVRVDAARAAELAGTAGADGVRCLTDLVLERLPAAGLELREVVLDVAGGHLRALLSLGGAGEPDVVGCPAEEGVALALRGGVHLYATDEAFAHAAAVPPGQRGADTLH